MTVPAGRLRDVLGITTVGFVPTRHELAVVDTPLSAVAASEPAGDQITIDNFSFKPAAITVVAGTKVTWINHDDEPHKIVANDKRFSSPVLDTDEKFSFQFNGPGAYSYFCSLHPQMTGTVSVRSR
jgi:plastocyanin